MGEILSKLVLSKDENVGVATPSWKAQSEDISALQYNVDLIWQTKKFLKLIKTFESYKNGFSQQTQLERDISQNMTQYKKFLALAVQDNTQEWLPPLPVLVIWVSHILRSKVYQADCLKKFGKQGPILNLDLQNSENAAKNTLQMLEKLDNFDQSKWPSITSSDVVFDLDFFEIAQKKCGNNLFDDSFIQMQLAYYEKVLFILKEKLPQECDVAIHIGMDLIWRAHILTPGYQKDMEKYLGEKKVPVFNPQKIDHHARYECEDDFQHLFGRKCTASLLFNPHGQDPLKVCPTEIFLQIADFMEFTDLLNMAHVSQNWRELISNHHLLWKRQFAEHAQWIQNTTNPVMLSSMTPKKMEEYSMKKMLEILTETATLDLYKNNHKGQWYRDWKKRSGINYDLKALRRMTEDMESLSVMK